MGRSGKATQGKRGKTHLVKGDRVKIIRGNHRDQEGTVLRVLPGKDRVVVEGINVVKKHQRPTQDNPEGGIITFEAGIHISNVMLIEPGSGEASRVRVRLHKGGEKERIAVKTGNPIPKP